MRLCYCCSWFCDKYSSLLVQIKIRKNNTNCFTYKLFISWFTYWGRPFEEEIKGLQQFSVFALLGLCAYFWVVDNTLVMIVLIYFFFDNNPWVYLNTSRIYLEDNYDRKSKKGLGNMQDKVSLNHNSLIYLKKG